MEKKCGAILHLTEVQTAVPRVDLVLEMDILTISLKGKFMRWTINLTTNPEKTLRSGVKIVTFWNGPMVVAWHGLTSVLPLLSAGIIPIILTLRKLL